MGSGFRLRARLLVLAAVAGCAQLPRRPDAAGGFPHAPHVDYGMLGTAFVGGDPPIQPLLVTRLQAIRVSDDSGAREARVRPDQVATWVAFANEVYRPAGIRFEFDPADFQTMRSTVLNNLRGPEQPDWRRAKREADEVADRFPDRLVVFFRYGYREYATGRGQAWPDYNFVVMPGWPDDRHCGHEHISALAHEIGHHLGLAHTFAVAFPEVDDADRFLASKDGDLSRLDGDELSDTAPDPGIRSTECTPVVKVQLRDRWLPLPRRNIMSYYDERDSLSEQQIHRLRWFLRERQTHHMKLPKNRPVGPALELEQLELLTQKSGRCSFQPMDQFGVGNWSAGSQLFCLADREQAVTVKLPVKSSGRQRLDLYLTRAPDYGVVEVLLDGEPIGRPYDAWAPAVLTSGRVTLGERRLRPGDHELTFRVRSKNAASTAFHLGVDAVALVSVEPQS